LLSTCIESSKLSLISGANRPDFFVCLQKVAVHHGLPPATTAAFRPKTPGQHVCPANHIPTLQTSSGPDRAMAQNLLVSNCHSQHGETHFCCHVPVAVSFHLAIPLPWGPSETRFPRSLLWKVCAYCSEALLAPWDGREWRIFTEAFYNSFESRLRHLGTCPFKASTPMQRGFIRINRLSKVAQRSKGSEYVFPRC
jgi:hypothetical protein